jgi:hypothetical protein
MMDDILETPTPLSMSDIRSKYSNRHPSVVHVLQFFANSHLPAELQEFTYPIQDLAFEMADNTSDSPSLTNGLWELLRAKDSFVRAKLISDNEA